jgi:hypothetical protein
MDEIIKELARITYAFVGRLKQVEYEEVLTFISQRDGLVDQVRLRERDVLPKHKTVIQNLLQYDELIQDKIWQLKDEASLKMKQFSNANLQKTGYDFYSGNDSVFFDRKK